MCTNACVLLTFSPISSGIIGWALYACSGRIIYVTDWIGLGVELVEFGGDVRVVYSM